MAGKRAFASWRCACSRRASPCRWTADDPVRDHDKLLIIDRRVLYVLSFNFTHLDIDHSRGFGIVTRKHKLVQEALKLLEADNDRTRYEAGLYTFVVSPVNARKQLLALIRRAKKELFIYDPKITHSEMLKALNERAKHGVDVRVIGALSARRARTWRCALSRSASGCTPARSFATAVKRLSAARACGKRSSIHGAKSASSSGYSTKSSKAMLDTFEADWGVKGAEETDTGHHTGDQADAEGDGREAVGAGSACERSSRRRAVEEGQHGSQHGASERDGRESGQGSRAGARAGNVEPIGGAIV